MQSIEKMKFKDFLFYFDSSKISLYKNTLAVLDIDNKKNSDNESEIEDKNLPLILEEVFMLVLTKKGSFKINIDYIPHIVNENSFMVLTQKHILQIISVSDDFKGYLIIVETNFSRGLLEEEKPLLAKGINSILFNPVFQLEKEEYILFKNSVERLKYNISRHKHFYYSKIVENEFANLSLELWNFFIQKSGKEIEHKPSGNREIIVTEFFKLLLTHIRKQREVAFYAEKLCISPVYLSRSVKHIIGMPAIKIINGIVISDAKLLLRKQKTTIQEVSEELNFPDQSTFSKFFKKHTGEPPIRYKQRN